MCVKSIEPIEIEGPRNVLVAIAHLGLTVWTQEVNIAICTVACLVFQLFPLNMGRRYSLKYTLSRNVHTYPETVTVLHYIVILIVLFTQNFEGGLQYVLGVSFHSSYGPDSFVN